MTSTTTAKFPAGTYVISDLCYVLSNKTWSELWELMFPLELDGKEVNGLFTLRDGRKLFMACTKYGDGIYRDNLDNDYGVDSGTIGIMLESEIDVDADGNNSHVHTFEHPFTVEYNDGNFSFGHINIDTSWSSDYDEDEEEWEEWED